MTKHVSMQGHFPSGGWTSPPVLGVIPLVLDTTSHCVRGTQRLFLGQMGQDRRTLGMFRAAPLKWQQKGIPSWSRTGDNWIALVSNQHPGMFLKTGMSLISTHRGHQDVFPRAAQPEQQTWQHQPHVLLLKSIPSHHHGE